MSVVTLSRAVVPRSVCCRPLRWSGCAAPSSPLRALSSLRRVTIDTHRKADAERKNEERQEKKNHVQSMRSINTWSEIQGDDVGRLSSPQNNCALNKFSEPFPEEAPQQVETMKRLDRAHMEKSLGTAEGAEAMLRALHFSLFSAVARVATQPSFKKFIL